MAVKFNAVTYRIGTFEDTDHYWPFIQIVFMNQSCQTLDSTFYFDRRYHQTLEMAFILWWVNLFDARKNGK